MDGPTAYHNLRGPSPIVWAMRTRLAPPPPLTDPLPLPAVPPPLLPPQPKRRRRGRPRKCDRLPPPPGFFSSPPQAPTLPHGVDSWQGRFDGLHPHVLQIDAGEEIIPKITSLWKINGRFICVLSVLGAVQEATLLLSSGVTSNYKHSSSGHGFIPGARVQGPLEIIRLFGSILTSNDHGCLRVTLASADSSVIGGIIAGPLIAATPVQAIVASFDGDAYWPNKTPKIIAHYPNQFTVSNGSTRSSECTNPVYGSCTAVKQNESSEVDVKPSLGVLNLASLPDRPKPKVRFDMLEELLIFTRGGLILWSSCRALGGAALRGSPIDALIRSCLLEERSADASFSQDTYALKWTFNNDLGLVFVAVYQRMLHLLYVDDLLAAVRKEFSQIYDPKRTSYDGAFNEIFRQLHLEAEARTEEMKKNKQITGSRPTKPVANKTAPGARTGSQGAAARKNSNSGKDDSDGDSAKEPNGTSKVQHNGLKDNSHARDAVVNGKENGDPNDGAFDVNKLNKLRKNKAGKKNDVAGNVTKNVFKAEPKKNVKKNRVWDDAPSNKKLDFTDPADERGDEVIDQVVVTQGESMMDKDDVKGWFSSMFKSIAGNNVLEKSDLQPALRALKDRLMTKNVAEEIAEKLCESVAASLEGKKLGSFTRISSTVQTAMEEALLRILTPRRSIDILRDVHAAKERGKPYVVVFVGVNGVGKSTNLAKVAYWLLQHNLSVMLAACDTFRSGAVEQLRTHARRLQIPIFEKGYEKDPAVVAKEAIQEATRNKSDVVLVDTAGRMQDNEPLMRALSKLINLNSPDLVLFVGEALVGNDAVDQLTKFNQKLADLSTVPTARLIDGILLTKFDTIDDKVGAALSMVYISGAPVMFVGCGQSYTDLKKLNVKSIVKTLLK
ncbi:hypothetical protein GUJ93_ZPchr0006g43990 [Zizania palustris]|uniref:PPC domain-containing protein n=1 Tax=Zizania palustris TaxID=103762 RepID=A0A8J5VN25_ZIZPA|nr:hypothetical protein GUJ93_ZPchr0006g43990 [Zizania palustris]